MASESELSQCLQSWKSYDNCKSDLINNDKIKEAKQNELAAQKNREMLKKIDSIVAENIKQLEFQKWNSKIDKISRAIWDEISNIQVSLAQIQEYYKKNPGNTQLDEVATNLKRMWIDVKWKMSETGMTNIIDPESIKSSVGERIKTIFSDYNIAEKSAQDRMQAEQQEGMRNRKAAEELRLAQEKAASQTSKVGVVDSLLRLKQYGRGI